MFTAIFQNHLGYLTAWVLAALALGGATWLLVRRLGKPYGFWWAGATSALAGVIGVTFMDGGAATGQCVVNHDLTQPFQTTQGLWNLALTVPLGFFATLAVRRPLPVLVGLITLPLAIEFTQATVNGLGRVCDSSDAEMNVVGGLVGFSAAVTALSVRRRPLGWQRGAKPSLITAVAILVLGSGVALPSLSLTHADGTGLSAADSQQREAAETAVNEAFGDRYEIGHVYDQPCAGAGCTNVVFALTSRDKNHPAASGNGTLSWPDRKHLNVLLEDSSRPTAMGYPVQDTVAPKSEQDAYRIATLYMSQRYPWAKDAVAHKTYPVGEKAEFGWITSWRWRQGEVLMPRMLDVQVSKAGRVSQVDVTLGPKVLELEKPRVRAEEAQSAVHEVMADEFRARGQQVPDDLLAEAFTLKATEREGTWRAEWLVSVSMSASGQQPDPQATTTDLWRVDSVSGQMYNGLDMPVETD
ncbi:VanZ family protein [Streptomyces sp. NPDC057674]|uniref:VanZ family protein n=1 Tax=Streptomyces sp. NPDC057674 TaxID=3346203 RepID=UPI0036A3243B